MVPCCKAVHISEVHFCYFGVLDKDKYTYTLFCKSNSEFGNRFQLHSDLLYVMRSRDLVCRALRISLQVEAFFRVSHSMIYHTEILMVTVIIDKIKLFVSKPQRRTWREGCGSISPLIVNLGTKWAVSFTPRPLCSTVRNSGTHWIGGWVSPSAGLDFGEKKHLLLLPRFEPRIL